MTVSNRNLNSAIDNALRTIAATQRSCAEALEILATEVRVLLEGASDDHPVEARVGPRLLTVAEAAERLGMSKSHVYRAVEEGRLTKVKIGNAVRIAVDDLEGYIESRKIEANVVAIGKTPWK